MSLPLDQSSWGDGPTNRLPKSGRLPGLVNRQDGDPQRLFVLPQQGGEHREFLFHFASPPQSGSSISQAWPTMAGAA